jgi:hypothetical protein
MEISEASRQIKRKQRLPALLLIMLFIAAGANLAALLHFERQISTLHRIAQSLSVSIGQIEPERRAAPRAETDASANCRLEVSRVDDAVVQLKSQAKALASAVADLKRLGAQTPHAMDPQFPFRLPSQPRDRPRRPTATAAPASLLSWRQSAPTDTVAYVDNLFQQHSAEMRERIAAETDPQQPDPSVVVRIMQESRDALSEQLRAVLPREEYDLLFPELRIPSGE